MRGICIYNPASRNAPHEFLINKLQSRFRSHGYEVEFQATVRPHHAAELARNAVASAVDLVVACGGDGTIHEVVEGLARSLTPLASAIGHRECACQRVAASTESLGSRRHHSGFETVPHCSGPMRRPILHSDGRRGHRRGGNRSSQFALEVAIWQTRVWAFRFALLVYRRLCPVVCVR